MRIPHGDIVTSRDTLPAQPGDSRVNPAVGVSEADGRSDPAAARRMLGGQLRSMREAAGISPERAAYEIRGSRAKISRIETGRARTVKQRDLLDLVALYGVSDAEVIAGLVVLARQAAASEWWQDFGDVLPAWFEPYLGMEHAALLIRSFDLLFVPGLLQTPGYARAVAVLGHRGARASEIERRVEVRMRRQQLLSAEDPPRVWAVIDEAALRRPVGGDAVMREQILRLAAATELPSVSLQVLPFSAGGHDSAGAFSILRSREAGVPDMVYVEQLNGAAYLDRETQVDHYRDVMNRLSAAATRPEDTAAFLAAMLRDYAMPP
jgi:transcriptional regulator with XRE-family HTH domain